MTQLPGTSSFPLDSAGSFGCPTIGISSLTKGRNLPQQSRRGACLTQNVFHLGQPTKEQADSLLAVRVVRNGAGELGENGVAILVEYSISYADGGSLPAIKPQ